MGKKTYIFLPFAGFEQTISDSRQKFPAGLSKLSLTASEECFWGFLRKYIFFITFAIWAKKNKSTFVGKFLVGLSNCYNYRGTFWKKLFLENYKFLFNFIDFERSFLRLSTKTIQQVCQNSSSRLQRSVSIIFLAKWTFFDDFQTLPAENYPNFGGNFLASFSKKQIVCPGDEFKGKYFLKKNKVFHQFRILSEINSDFCRISFGRVVKNAIWVSKRSFWGQTISGKSYMFFLIVFGALFRELWRKHFCMVVLTAFFLSRWRVEESERKYFSWKKFFWHFRIFSKKFGISGIKKHQARQICILDIQRTVMRTKKLFSKI